MKKRIKIQGMMCDSCKNRVKNTLEKIDGVSKVEVSLEEKLALIESNKEIDNNLLKEVIENLGYDVIDV